MSDEKRIDQLTPEECVSEAGLCVLEILTRYRVDLTAQFSGSGYEILLVSTDEEDDSSIH